MLQVLNVLNTFKDKVFSVISKIIDIDVELQLFLAAIVAVISFYAFTGGVSETDASITLSSQGYTDVEYTGYEFFECEKNDLFHTGFQAKNAQGIIVKGTVCSGLLSGGYIRN